MKRKSLFYVLPAIALCFAACDDDENKGGTPQVGAYVIAANGENGTYLLQTDNVDNDNLTIENTGIESENATVWWFHANKYLYRLTYAQGEAGLGASFELNAEGTVRERNVGFKIDDRFTTYGSYGKYIITAAAKATSFKDDAGNFEQGIAFTILDTEAQSKAVKIISSENMLGNGEYTTVSGIVDVNNKIYTAICPIGVSAYGAARGVDTVRTTTIYPDSVWVAIYDNLDFENPKILRDDRLSYASSRYRSQYYSNIVSDAKGNVYVFSSCYDANSKKKSGVLRINSGTEVFDKDYYFDIEAASGGIHLFKVWHVTGDYFLLQMYTTSVVSPMGDSRRLAVFNASAKTFTWVQGLPELDVIGSLGGAANGPGGTPLAENGKFYIPVTTIDDQQPAIYVINPATATATKGTVVTSDAISAVGKLVYNQ
jgi:hypothetical protein